MVPRSILRIVYIVANEHIRRLGFKFSHMHSETLYTKTSNKINSEDILYNILAPIKDCCNFGKYYRSSLLRWIIKKV